MLENISDKPSFMYYAWTFGEGGGESFGIVHDLK